MTINNRDHKNNIIGIATLLLQYNADPNWKKRNDDYLLNLIVNQKNSEKGAIKLLLDYKANPCHYSFNHSRDYYLPYQKIEPNKSQYHHDLYFELLLAIPAWIKEKNKPAFETFLLCMHRLKNGTQAAFKRDFF